MINYRGVLISVNEQASFQEGDFNVSRSDGLVYRAESEHGRSYAQDPEVALEGARRQIDAAFDRG